MNIDVRFTESTSEILVQFQDLQIITNGVPPEEVSKLVADAEAKGTEVGKQAGIQAEYDRFWDVYQENGNRVDYGSAFYGEGWNDETFVPKYDIVITKHNHSSIFATSTITDLKGLLEKCGVVLDLSGSLGAHATFQSMSKNTRLPKIDLRSCSSSLYRTCWGCDSLVEIEEWVANEKATYSDAFRDCTSLTTIKFSGTIGNAIGFPQSSLLSGKSVQSIVDHLKDLTGLTAQTLTFHADVGARMTDAQKAIVTAKNWTLVY